MTEDDLKRVETTIGHPFPVAVRTFFLNFPPGLRKSDEERDPDDSDFELTDDSYTLIELNKPVGGVIIPNAGPNVFVLGCGGCGETWWVDLDSENGTVYFCDAGTYAEDSDHVADSLAEFAQGILESDKGE